MDKESGSSTLVVVSGCAPVISAAQSTTDTHMYNSALRASRPGAFALNSIIDEVNYFLPPAWNPAGTWP